MDNNEIEILKSNPHSIQFICNNTRVINKNCDNIVIAIFTFILISIPTFLFYIFM